jgi:Reverse transcriptase (RNA-dependent DNA polymerase)
VPEKCPSTLSLQTSLSLVPESPSNTTPPLPLASLSDRIARFVCQPAPPRPNTTPLFPLFDPNEERLTASPSPFNIPAWRHLLTDYPGNLPDWLVGILTSGCHLGDEGPPQFIVSDNLPSATLAPDIITTKLVADLSLQRVAQYNPWPTGQHPPPFISSPLGLAPKSNGTFRRIHHLSHPPDKSVNDYIPVSYGSFDYSSLTEIYAIVVQAGRGCMIIKKDIRDAFRNIPISPRWWWLLGFFWDGQYFTETCLPFGLRTAPIIFNLFAEAFHWILESWLGWVVAHYLDDFIRVLEASRASKEALAQAEEDYHLFTTYLGIPEASDKDVCGTQAVVLGVLIDTVAFEARLDPDKLDKARCCALNAVTKGSLTLREVESLAGYLNWCSYVARIGKLYMHHIWDFRRSFPDSSSHSFTKELPRELKLDLIWWANLLPDFNGVTLLEEERPIVHLTTDASSKGLGAYFYVEVDGILHQKDSFSIELPNFLRKQHINVLELRAIMVAFYFWSPRWRRLKVIIHTDSTAAWRGLNNLKLRGPGFYPLRHISLLAASHDILIEPLWIQGKENMIADALSRFNWDVLADCCPHWQIPYLLTPYPQISNNLLELTHISGQIFSGTD